MGCCESRHDASQFQSMSRPHSFDPSLGDRPPPRFLPSPNSPCSSPSMTCIYGIYISHRPTSLLHSIEMAPRSSPSPVPVAAASQLWLPLHVLMPPYRPFSLLHGADPPFAPRPPPPSHPPPPPPSPPTGGDAMEAVSRAASAIRMSASKTPEPSALRDMRLALLSLPREAANVPAVPEVKIIPNPRENTGEGLERDG
jgi:hypothetical protein